MQKEMVFGALAGAFVVLYLAYSHFIGKRVQKSYAAQLDAVLTKEEHRVKGRFE